MPYYVGLDLGQSADYTALSVVHDTYVPSEESPGYQKQLQIVHLERYALRTSYVDIVEHVTELLRNDALHPWEMTRPFHQKQTHPTLIVDSTGVGAPVTDLLTKKKVPYVGITITGGTTVTRGRRARKFGVPKRDLVSALEVPFHNGRLVIARDLELRPTLEKELQNFKRKIRLTTGHDSYEHWREGDHDDLVLACALAVWWCTHRTAGTRKLRIIR